MTNVPAMMTDAEVLLAAVCADPSADLPRLVYADEIEESEPLRSEFIRIQCDPLIGEPCRCVRMSRLDHHCETCAARDRERELFLEFNREWFGDTGLALPSEDLSGMSPHAPILSIRRGFVAEVRCPFDWWFGGKCGRCNGTGELGSAGDYDQYLIECRECRPEGINYPTRGTGRTPDHGPALVRTQPVERVTLTDREPMVDGYEVGGFSWWSQSATIRSNPDPHPASTLSDDVMLLMEGGVLVGNGYRTYPTRESAADALSDALILHAKQPHRDPA